MIDFYPPQFQFYPPQFQINPTRNMEEEQQLLNRLHSMLQGPKSLDQGPKSWDKLRKDVLDALQAAEEDLRRRAGQAYASHNEKLAARLRERADTLQALRTDQLTNALVLPSGGAK